MHRRARNLTIGLALVALAACAGERGGAGIIIDTIGGVPSVMNPDRGMLGDTVPWQLSQYLLVAGDQLYDRKAAVYALDVGILPNGNVVVLDAGNRRVLRFGPDGAYLDAFGGPGSGPGQFATPLFIEVAGERLYVLDSSLDRVTAFDSAGIFLSRFQVNLAGLAGTTPLFVVGGPEEIYVAAEPVPFLAEVRDTGQAVIYRVAASGALADTIVTFRASSWTQLEGPEGRSSYVKPRLAPAPKVAATQGVVALAMGAAYLLEVRRPDGSLVRRVARQYENVAVTPEIRDSVLNQLAKGPQSLPREALELLPFAPMVPAIEGIVADDQGRLWVDPYAADPKRRDIFDAEGRYLGALYLPQPFKLEDVRGDRACGTVSDPSGQSAVVCYRVVTRR